MIFNQYTKTGIFISDELIQDGGLFAPNALVLPLIYEAQTGLKPSRKFKTPGLINGVLRLFNAGGYHSQFTAEYLSWLKRSGHDH